MEGWVRTGSRRLIPPPVSHSVGAGGHSDCMYSVGAHCGRIALEEAVSDTGGKGLNRLGYIWG